MRYFIVIFFLSAILFAEELHWYDDYKEAKSMAKQTHKLIYVFISSAHCGWCHKFENTTLQDKDVQKELDQDFIAVHLIRDFDTIPKKFQVSPVPRHYFTDAKGNILYDTLGYREVDSFKAYMGYAKDQIQNKEK